MKKLFVFLAIAFCVNSTFAQCAANNWYGLGKISTISVDNNYMTITPAAFASGEYWCGTTVKIPMSANEPYKTWRAQAYIALTNGNQINFHTNLAAADNTGGVLDVAGYNVYFAIYK